MKKSDLKNFPLLLQEYFTYQSAIKEKSELTILEYASDLRCLLRYIKKENGLVKSNVEFNSIDISDITNDFILNLTDKDAIKFLSFCSTDLNNNANTRSRKVSTIRSFYKWITYHEHLLDNNPMEHLESPKHQKSLPKYLTLDDCLKLLSSIDGTYKERDYCIITFFLNCGLRLSELVSLNYSDIRSDNTLKVLGKGKKERTIYLNDACIHAFNEYIKVRPTDGLKDRNALFISRNKRRISNRAVENIVYGLLDKAGLSGLGLSTHKLRHTAATLMYQQGGADVMLIKEILGHETVATTEIYTHVVNSQLKGAVDSNPLSKIKQQKNQIDQ